MSSSRSVLWPVVAVGLLLVLAFYVVPQLSARHALIEGVTMGTTYRVRVPVTMGPVERRALKKDIAVRLEEINALMSMFDKNSALSQLNKADAGKAFDVHPELFGVLELAMTVSKTTGGAFDVTVGPLVELWGFGTNMKRFEELPDFEQVEKIRATTGFEKLVLDSKARTATRTNEGLSVDLSAIAKGYGVDAIAGLLHTKGYNDYMVEIGGEMRVAGYRNPSTRELWRIGLEKPVEHARLNDMILHLSDISVATSGDYRNYFIYNGERYSHTIDPGTGFPVAGGLTSASVFAEQCAKADAFATALMVMPAKQAKQFVEDNNMAAILVYRTGDDGKYERYISTMAKPYTGTP